MFQNFSYLGSKVIKILNVRSLSKKNSVAINHTHIKCLVYCYLKERKLWGYSDAYILSNLKTKTNYLWGTQLKFFRLEIASTFGIDYPDITETTLANGFWLIKHNFREIFIPVKGSWDLTSIWNTFIIFCFSIWYFYLWLKANRSSNGESSVEIK